MGNGTRRGSFCLRQKLKRAILAQPKSLRRAGAGKHGITTAASAKVRTIARIEKAAVRDLQRYCRSQADPSRGASLRSPPHSASAAAFTMSAIWRKRKTPQCKALLPSTRGSQLCRSPPATYPVPYRYKTQTAVHSNCRTPPKIQPDSFYSASTSSFFLKKSEMHQSAESATRM